VGILKSLNYDRNIVQFYGACLRPGGDPLLVCEYMEGEVTCPRPSACILQLPTQLVSSQTLVFRQTHHAFLKVFTGSADTQRAFERAYLRH